MYNIQERLTLSGQLFPLPPSADTSELPYSGDHHSTYGTQHPLSTDTNSLASTSPVQRLPTAITLLPLNTSTTLALEQ